MVQPGRQSVHRPDPADPVPKGLFTVKPLDTAGEAKAAQGKIDVQEFRGFPVTVIFQDPEKGVDGPPAPVERPFPGRAVGEDTGCPYDGVQAGRIAAARPISGQAAFKEIPGEAFFQVHGFAVARGHLPFFETDTQPPGQKVPDRVGPEPGQVLQGNGSPFRFRFRKLPGEKGVRRRFLPQEPRGGAERLFRIAEKRPRSREISGVEPLEAVLRHHRGEDLSLRCGEIFLYIIDQFTHHHGRRAFCVVPKILPPVSDDEAVPGGQEGLQEKIPVIRAP